MSYTIKQFSERAILIQFDHQIELKGSQLIHTIFNDLVKLSPEWYIDAIPAFNSLTIEYDPFEINFNQISNFFTNFIPTIKLEKPTTSIVYTIPVCYDPEFGIDIQKLAKGRKITVEEVISWHTKGIYVVNMIGFSPGFPYMGPIPDQIVYPRLKTPRLKIRKGSVGIGKNQTGIYPQEGSSGWNIIGVTPIKIVNLKKKNPFLLKAGDFVKFEPINKKTFLKIEKNNSNWKIQ